MPKALAAEARPASVVSYSQVDETGPDRCQGSELVSSRILEFWRTMCFRVRNRFFFCSLVKVGRM